MLRLLSGLGYPSASLDKNRDCKKLAKIWSHVDFLMIALLGEEGLMRLVGSLFPSSRLPCGRQSSYSIKRIALNHLQCPVLLRDQILAIYSSSAPTPRLLENTQCKVSPRPFYSAMNK